MKEFFSVKEVAKLLNLSTSAVLYHIKSAHLRAQPGHGGDRRSPGEERGVDAHG